MQTSRCGGFVFAALQNGRYKRTIAPSDAPSIKGIVNGYHLGRVIIGHPASLFEPVIDKKLSLDRPFWITAVQVKIP
jgi:hypothetical protein